MMIEPAALLFHLRTIGDRVLSAVIDMSTVCTRTWWMAPMTQCIC